MTLDSNLFLIGTPTVLVHGPRFSVGRSYFIIMHYLPNAAGKKGKFCQTTINKLRSFCI